MDGEYLLDNKRDEYVNDTKYRVTNCIYFSIQRRVSLILTGDEVRY